MRKAVLLLCILLSASSCWSRGGYRGRELAIRGMKMVAREGATQAQQDRGWDLVAQGLGVLLSLPGKWGAEEWQTTGDIRWFLERCAWAAGLSGEHKTDQARIQRDGWGPCDAVLVTVYCRSRSFGPRFPAAKLLIAKVGDSMITGGWRRQVGCSPGEEVHDWRHGDLAAWVSQGKAWAVIAGARSGGGSGQWPSAVVCRRAGSTWRVVNRIDMDRGWRDGFSLRDLNQDGVPEIVGNTHDRPSAMPGDAPVSEYIIYKFVGNGYKKVWHVRRQDPPAAQS